MKFSDRTFAVSLCRCTVVCEDFAGHSLLALRTVIRSSIRAQRTLRKVSGSIELMAHIHNHQQ